MGTAGKMCRFPAAPFAHRSGTAGPMLGVCRSARCAVSDAGGITARAERQVSMDADGLDSPTAAAPPRKGAACLTRARYAAAERTCSHAQARARKHSHARGMCVRMRRRARAHPRCRCQPHKVAAAAGRERCRPISSAAGPSGIAQAPAANRNSGRGG